jgi:hypothetical protein
VKAAQVTASDLSTRLLALLQQLGPSSSAALARRTRAQLGCVLQALRELRHRDFVEYRAGRWCSVPPGAAAWPAVDRVLHGMPADPITPNRRRSAGTTSKDRR